MSIKDIFENKLDKIVSNTQLEELYKEAESESYVDEIVVDNSRYLPDVDFSNPANFARYGSAKRYYIDSIKNIYENYPYDGSKKEKQEWRNLSSQFDLYVFDKIYPKTTGYVNLAVNSTIDIIDPLSEGIGYRNLSPNRYIIVKGGPNSAASGKFEDSNIYDISKNRESNLAISEYGNTVEFWFKDEKSSSNIPNFCLFNLIGLGTNNELTIEKSFNGFRFTYVANGIGILKQEVECEVDMTVWHHYAFTLKNDVEAQNHIKIEIYIDGNLVKSKSILGNGYISNVNNLNLIGIIGAFYAEYGHAAGSFDEFRFWKTARTSQQIYRNWYTQVGGGTNTDDSNTSLGVYFKFNEGIVGNSLDSICLDYSGRISNGSIINYSSGVRSTGSAIDIYYGEEKEFKDPIVYSFNPSVEEAIEYYSNLGSIYDENNATNIYKSLPAWISEQAENLAAEDLENLVQIISSYFDTIHNQIESLPKIKNTEYIKDGEKSKPFIKTLLTSYGFEVNNIFNDSTFFEEMLSRNEKDIFKQNLLEVKNTIYQNIYNSLSHIYKAKGTEKSFRNLIRCFGVDDELIKINLYSNNTQYEFKNRYKFTTNLTNVINLNEVDSYTGTVIQNINNSTDTNVRGYIKGDERLKYIPLTAECEVIFPKKIDKDNLAFVSAPFTTVSIFGAHTAFDSETNLAWSGSNDFNFQVYAVKKEIDSDDAYFALVSNGFSSSILLTSSYYRNIYNNNKWNLSVKITPNKYSNVDIVSGSSDTGYTLKFIGINSTLNNVDESFELSANLPSIATGIALSKNKRFYIGSHYQNFNTSSSVLAKSDLKFSSLKIWFDDLSSEELISHSFDNENFGRMYPNWKVYNFNSSLKDLNILANETLALNWNFNQVTGSDSQGKFFVEDASYKEDNSNWFKNIICKRHVALGSNVKDNSEKIINKEFLQAAKHQNPEILSDSDLISIEETDSLRTKDNTFTNYFFSVEKSMYQAIDKEILNWFATINDFNNLVGSPIDRYKKEYKDLKHLRELFFQKVENTPNFEKFIEFYKWLDSSLSSMINNLVPASSNFSEDVSNMVESHILERNKYENKLPTLEINRDIVSTVTNNNGFEYPEQKAPSSPAGRLWEKQRVERTSGLYNTPGQLENDVSREIIRQVINSKNLNKVPKLYDVSTGTQYEGKKDIVRFFGKIYNLTASFVENPQKIINPVKVQNIQFDSEPQYKIVSGSEQIVQPIKFQGNYYNRYEVVQLSGRTSNNKSFVNLEGAVSGTSTVSPYTNTVERSLPERKKVKTIFVERFSSPGGVEASGRGVLNAESEEFSPYNTVNYRNLKTRTYLTKWESESSSLDSENPSWHKVNKNNSYTLDENGNEVKKHDNLNIIRQIPQSDSQYSWIARSYTSKPKTSGYLMPYDNINSYNASSLIITSGSKFGDIVINHAGILTSIETLKEIDLTTNTISPQPNIGDNIGKYLANNGAKFGNATWKQIRKEDNKITQILKKQNKIAVQDSPVQKFRTITDSITKQQFTETYINKKEQTFTSYIEPPVSYNKPMSHTLLVSGSEKALEIVSTYDNNKNKFSNENLSKHLGVKNRNEPQVHDILVNLAENGQFEPKPEIEKIEYSQVLFPESTNAGLSIIRSKPNYAEEVGTGSNGYDRNVAEIRSFWRDSVENRKRTRAVDSSTKTGSVNSLNYAQISASNSSFEKIYYSNPSILNYNSGSTSIIQADYLTIKYLISSSTDSINILENYISNSYNLNFSQSIATIPGTELRLNYIFVTASMPNTNVIGDLATDPLYKQKQYVLKQNGSYMTKSFADPFGEYLFQYDNNYERVIPKPQYSYTNWYPFGYRYNFNLFINGNVNLSPSLYYNNGFKFQHTFNLLNNKPFYESYTDYLEDIKPLSSKYSILPEYKVSDFMDFYIKDLKGSFTKNPNNTYLKIIGKNEKLSNNLNTNNLNNFTLQYNKDNKISLKIKGIKKLLPYNGFYPSQRSLQIVNLFQKSLFNFTTDDYLKNDFATANGYDMFASGGCPADQQILTLMQPFFAPGILYNTIKSSIAVDWASVITTSLSLPYSGSESLVYNSFLKLYTTGSTYDSMNLLANYTVEKTYNYRFPFETILDPTNVPEEIKNQNLIYINPSLYGTDINNPDRNDLRIPSYQFKHLSDKSLNKNYDFIDERYTLSINNFFAEIVNFFLKDGKLNSFTSKEENSFSSVVPGKTYFMDVFLKKDDKFKQVLTYQNPEKLAKTDYVWFFEGSSFGPRTRFFNKFDFFNNLNGLSNYLPVFNEKVAFAPFLPSYELGESIVRLSFKPESSYVTLNDIFKNISVEYINSSAEKLFLTASELLNISAEENYKNSPSYKCLMKPDASINLFNIIKNNLVSYDQYGKPIEISDVQNNNKSKWIIQTKFETPSLNYNHDVNYINDINSFEQYFTGMWAGSGSIPNSGDGIQFGIKESFNVENNLTGSLLKVCGFTPSTKDIGQIAQQKQISEMIVMIPYIEKGNENFNINNDAKNINGIIGEGPETEFTRLQGPFYFAVDKEKINSILNTQFDSTTTEQLKKILEASNKTQSNSIAKQMKAMTEFNFPPHLDWITNRNVEPFVMYTFEFKHTLDQEDLSLIWQGVMPKIAKTASLDEVTFEHSLGEDEFFHGKKLPDNIKFKIFKVKKKAKMSYYDLVEDINADKRFKFEFAGGKTTPDYSYNYPYDFFSLVELVNVESTIENSKPINVTKPTTTTVSQSEAELAREKQQNKLEARKNKKIGKKFD